MTRRREEFSNKTRVQAWERSGGHCEQCTRKLFPGDIEYDHRIPDGLGGSNDLENCVVLCRSCHGVKTAKADVPQIAKAKRVSAKHFGAKKSTFGRLPGSRDSKFKKRIDGTVVRRDEA